MTIEDMPQPMRRINFVGALFLVVQRLGGEVELTAKELSSLDPRWELVSWNNPATDGLVVKCRSRPRSSRDDPALGGPDTSQGRH